MHETINKTRNRISLLTSILYNRNRKKKPNIYIDEEGLICIQEEKATVRIEHNEIVKYLEMNGFKLVIEERERIFPDIEVAKSQTRKVYRYKKIGNIDIED